MTNRNRIVQGRGRNLIFHHGRKNMGFCSIIPTPSSRVITKMKELLPFLYVWIRGELRNQEALLSETRNSARIEKLAETVIEYHFRAVESLRHPKINRSLDSFETAFELKLREEAISYANSEKELVDLNTLCIQAIPLNYFDFRFLSLSSEDLETTQRSIIQTHNGESFPFTAERKTA